jgi:undecaprenyl-diphosphatase
MLWLNAALSGIMEGITDFLPISSVGHLILVRDLLPLNISADPAQNRAFADLFAVWIQLPAILAVLAIFRQRLWKEAVDVVHNEAAARRFWLGMLVAFLPVVIVGVLLHHPIEKYLFGPLPIACALFVGGVVILAVERWGKPGDVTRAEDLSYRHSIVIGLFQCLSLIPGTSRSASTIVGARVQGLNRSTAAEYSFFLGLPTLCAAGGYKLLGSIMKGDIDWSVAAAPLLIGSITSFVTALLVVEWFMNYLRKRTLSVFGWYRIALAIVVVAVKTY